MNRKLRKKGIAPYISWMLLMSFAVALSAFMYTWMTDQVTTSTEALEQRTDTAMCDDVGLSVVNYCQNTQTLNINISNVKLLTINRVNFRFFDLYDNPDTRSLNVTIRPGDTESLEVIKQGTLSQAEIIPVTIQDDKIISCTKSIVTLENIKVC